MTTMPMNPRRGGLFGGGITYDPRRQQPQPTGATGTFDGGMGLPQPEQPRRGLGTRLLGEGWQQKVAALGGLISGDPNAVARYHATQNRAQQIAEQRAFEQRQASVDRQNDWSDWVRRQEYSRANPAPVIRENNMGDVVRIDPSTNESQIIYEDPYAPTVVGPDGRSYPLQMTPRRPVGALTMIDGEPQGEEQGATLTVTSQQLNALIQEGRMTPQRANEAMAAGRLVVRN